MERRRVRAVRGEIRAARVGTDGVVADPNGVVLVAADVGTDQPVLAASGTKVAVFFRGSVPGTSNGFGVVLASHELATVGSPIRVGSFPSSYYDVTFDGSAFRLAWHEFSFFTGLTTLQTQRIDDTGTFVDAKLVLHDAPFNVPVKTATVGSTTLVVHADQRGGDTNLYGRRLSGASVLDEQWFLLPTGATAQANPSIAWDGDQYFSVWEHCCGGTTGNDIHGRFFDADGAPIGPEVAISSAITHESEPRIAFDGTRFLVVWREISGARGR